MAVLANFFFKPANNFPQEKPERQSEVYPENVKAFPDIVLSLEISHQITLFCVLFPGAGEQKWQIKGMRVN